MYQTLNNRIDLIYPVFQDWCDTQGLDFPCTVDQFTHRAIGFSRANYSPLFTQRVVDLLCRQGIGSDWLDKLFERGN